MDFGGIANFSAKRPAARSSGFQSLLATRRAKHQIADLDAELAEIYPHPLNFYLSAPTYSISLEEFEKYAVERLKLLRLIERINLTHDAKFSQEYYQDIRQEIKRNQLPTYEVLFSYGSKYSSDDHLQSRKIDHIAHFLLRLAFARTDEQRKWLISMEVDLFRAKLIMSNSGDLDSLIEKHDLPYEKAKAEEVEKFGQQILDSTFTIHGHLPRDIYKVHFTQALDLVRTRNVFLHNGYAYVPQNELGTVMCLKFRSYLSESLSIIKKKIHLVEDDERLRPLIAGFEKRHLGTDASIGKSGDVVTVAQLSTFAEKSFPLCMKHVYEVVQKEHHLKHWGRLQLGLFFKGLGVQMEEATNFWRHNFTKRPEIDSSRFDKQYLYNIRHMYGKEGKRADYTPYSCMKVINSSVGPGDHHGCPFRHSDATPLRVKLVDACIAQEGIKEIMNLVENKHFQIACQRYFEWTHDKHTVDGGVNHPNQYFMESRSVLTGKKTIKAEDKVEARRTLYYKDGSRSTQNQKDEQSSEPMDVTDINSALDMDADDELFSQLDY